MQNTKNHKYAIGLGSNTEPRGKHMETAIANLWQIGQLEASSHWVESKSWGYSSTEVYINCCVLLRSDVEPQALLAQCKQWEREAGRVTSTMYTDRPIDYDILWWNGPIHTENNLFIPHLAAHKRDFVMVGLAELLPREVHPVLQQTFQQLFTQMPKPYLLENCNL